ncbi:MAG: manganese efflux pump MntP family protein [Coriobacteriales bacterium]|nr:manganese efflux pump MntP family protein [Coriobacteriales bacterium]
MGIVELLLVAVGLSMDAFAVSVCKGLGMRRFNTRIALVLAVLFGLFQGLMPLIGWFAGSQFLWLIGPIDHWIAFGLLAFIGGKMIWDATHEEDEGVRRVDRIEWGEFLMLAVATSIDALAVGISFAALTVDIVPAVLLIGITTFILSFLGVIVGNFFGARYEKPAQIIGGVVLICIGLKVLLEHLGLAFWV